MSNLIEIVRYHISFAAITAAVFLFTRFTWTTPSQPDRATTIRFQSELHDIVFASSAGHSRPTRTTTIVYTGVMINLIGLGNYVFI